MKTCRKGIHQFEGIRCFECKKESMAKWRKENPEKAKNSCNNWRNKNKEYLKLIKRKWHEKNREKINSRTKELYSKNIEKKRLSARNSYKKYSKKRIEYVVEWGKKNKDKRKKYVKENRERHPDKHCATQAKRRARKLMATPKWLNEQHFNEINKFYKKAQELTKSTGIIHHVDHIIPLKGENVCGLHVPWNLQILTMKENISKSNKIINEDGDL